MRHRSFREQVDARARAYLRRRRRGAQHFAGGLIALAAALIVLAIAACGHIPPTPTPVPNASCVEGCRHQHDDLHCDTSAALCERLCDGDNNPGYPACLAGATTCAEAAACQ